jgi:hypothetical protein
MIAFIAVVEAVEMLTNARQLKCRRRPRWPRGLLLAFPPRLVADLLGVEPRRNGSGQMRVATARAAGLSSEGIATSRATQWNHGVDAGRWNREPGWR